MVKALVHEIALQYQYLADHPLDTIYFGGGTPSLLDERDLDLLFESINKHFKVQATAEITLEANPDDLSAKKLQQLKNSPINRLSIGIQSFFEEDLQWMNRAHTATEAKHCIQEAQSVGFSNLTIDLIYGTPTTSNKMWLDNIQTTIDLQIPHISCYALTVEPKTALAHFVKKGQKKNTDEQQAAEQFELLISTLEAAGYEHYEISNFAKPNCHARHNSNYWLGKPYLGIGPSAHSYNRNSRQWNIANNQKYLQSIQQGILSFEKEKLSNTTQYNEYVLTTLRTKWGSQLSTIQQWGEKYSQHFAATILPFRQEGLVIQQEDTFRLSQKGKLLADRISMELFYEE